MLVVVSLLAFLPGFFQVPPVDRDEARFAQATKQMIETGDYIDIKFQDETRYKKPVGIYWLQAGVVQLAEALGVPRARLRIWLYRIPSLIGAIGVVVATYWTALAFVSRRAAFLAGLVMATSILLGVEARLAKTDAVLSLTVVAAMGAMARAYLAGQGERSVNTHPLVTAAVFWTAIALGILIKGPLILMIAGLAIVALAVTDRSVNWILRLKPAMGAIWVLALVLPWFIAIIIRSGDSFFVEAIGHDLLAKVESGQESHGVPPGFYLLLFWVTFFPGAMLAGLAAPAVWRARGEPGARFLLAWLVPSWIVFELVPTKLPHYVLPLYPAIAILIVGVVDGQSLSRNRWLVRGTMWWFILIAAVGVGLVAINLTIGQRLGLPSWAFGAAAAILALFAWTLYRVDGAEASLVRAGAASIMLSVAAYSLTFGKIGDLFPAVPCRTTSAAPIVQSRYGDRRLSRAEPGVPGRHQSQPRRRCERCGFPQRRQLPLRLHREKPGALLRSARRCAGAALLLRAAHRGLQHQRRPSGLRQDVPFGGGAMTASRRGRRCPPPSRCARTRSSKTPAMRSWCCCARRGRRARVTRMAALSRPGAVAAVVVALADQTGRPARLPIRVRLPLWLVDGFYAITDFGHPAGYPYHRRTHSDHCLARLAGSIA